MPASLTALAQAFGTIGLERRIEQVRALADGMRARSSSPRVRHDGRRAPDGRLTVVPPAPSWLRTAGTGDVLAGIDRQPPRHGGRSVRGAPRCEACWLHGEAARLAGPAFSAERSCRSCCRGLRRRSCERILSKSSASPRKATASPRRAGTCALSAPGDCPTARRHRRAGAASRRAALPPFPALRRLPAAALRRAGAGRFVSDRVVNAAEGQGLVRRQRRPAVHLSPPRSRRRATLQAVNGGGRALVGFREAGSHRLVDIRRMPRPRARAVRAGRPLRACSHRGAASIAAESTSR